MRLAYLEDISTKEDFVRKYPTEIMDLMEYWPNVDNAEDKIDEIYSLVTPKILRMLLGNSSKRLLRYTKIHIAVYCNSRGQLLRKSTQKFKGMLTVFYIYGGKRNAHT